MAKQVYNSSSKKYRFDDQYEAVYEYNGDSYVYIGSYLQYKIKTNMREATKINLVDNYQQW